jgi:hypothetical protein
MIGLPSLHVLAMTLSYPALKDCTGWGAMS